VETNGLEATTFTIAIPTHNRRETALLAARSALGQTRPPIEVVVLCDGCTDGTADAVRAVGDSRLVAVELAKGPGYGYAHRNVALEAARGTVILWLGDDDLLLPDHLERIGERWDEGDVDIVTAPASVVHPDDRMEWLGEDWSVPRSRERLFVRNSNVMASVSIAVRLAREVGGWDGALARAADWDLWKRAILAGGRPGAVGDVGVLHFRGTDRCQSWPDRVRQNTAWLARLENPRELASLRLRLARLRMERDAAVLGRLAERDRRLAHIEGTRWWRVRIALSRLVRRSGATGGG
jgi:glycosyltransferase involved in cell wall biosynthesis